METEKGNFKWKKIAVWVPDPKGRFTLDPRGMVMKEGEGTVLIKGFDVIKELKKEREPILPEEMITEIRMYLAERLLRLMLWIVPIKHRDGRNLVRHIKNYAEEMLTENNIPYEK